MFRHILIPTDGSETSGNAVRAGMAFAKETGAKVTGLHVCAEFHVFTSQVEALEEGKANFSRNSVQHAIRYLAELEAVAKELGVECDTLTLVSDSPYEAIVNTAQQRHCDLIIMASHGRKGMKGILLGSETHKVLTHTAIPVLVYR